MADDGTDPQDRPTLSDVLAALVTSVSRARVQADLSSAEVARLYQRHDLLRAMPIPRLRLNRVQVSLPLVVTAVRKGEGYRLRTEGDDEVGRRVVQDVARSIDTLRQGLMTDVWTALGKTSDAPGGERRVSFPGPEKSAPEPIVDRESEAGKLMEDLYDALEDALEQLESGAQPKIYADAVREALEPFRRGYDGHDATSELGIHELCGKAVERVLKRRLDLRRGNLRRIVEDEASSAATELAQARALDAAYPLIMGERDPSVDLGGLRGSYARDLFKQLLAVLPGMIAVVGEQAGFHAFASPPKAPEVEIAVHTAEVKNEGTPGTITRINMVMSEEGLEWVAESTDEGKPQWKLVPE
jgi:hypothetical protein